MTGDDLPALSDPLQLADSVAHEPGASLGVDTPRSDFQETLMLEGSVIVTELATAPIPLDDLSVVSVPLNAEPLDTGDICSAAVPPASTEPPMSQNDMPLSSSLTCQHVQDVPERAPCESDATPLCTVLSRRSSPLPEEHAGLESELAVPTSSTDPAPLSLLLARDEEMQIDLPDPTDFNTLPMTVEIPELDVEFDLPPSSPPPSSSPPHIFSSSPPRDVYETPPSSSPPLSGPQKSYPDCLDDETTASGNLTSCETSDSLKYPTPVVEFIESEADEDERKAKRAKTEPQSAPSDPPQPKRLTQASVAKQRKKLAAPFRSPVIKGPLIQGGLHAVYATGRAFTSPPSRKPAGADDVVEKPAQKPADVKPDPAVAKPDPTLANRDRTANAAKQFKSPLVASGGAADPATPASTGGTLFSTAKATPTIQALQGKLQTLKQAIRIKKSGKEDEEDELERLVAKWTIAGREVAWAVWDYVKDLDPGTGCAGETKKDGWFNDGDGPWGAKSGEKRGFDAGWGYDDGHPAKKARLDDGIEEKTEVEDEEGPPVVQHTLGTMLRHLGIDPATLGWNEEEGDFVDA
ncbi:hypothetical protein C2E23DRAFT_820237 [Lenzites betulinus]|nr:hypothetical protein C2E23DRAFT_820237 [Lenzites betulinus]